MIDESSEKCCLCGKETYVPINGKDGFYCSKCYDVNLHTQYVYPKNPKLNGNACIGPDGINIYDHLTPTGEINWDEVKISRDKKFNDDCWRSMNDY